MLVAKNGLEYVSFDADETLGLLRLIGLVFVPFLIGLYWMWNENASLTARTTTFPAAIWA